MSADVAGNVVDDNNDSERGRTLAGGSDDERKRQQELERMMLQAEQEDDDDDDEVEEGRNVGDRAGALLVNQDALNNAGAAANNNNAANPGDHFQQQQQQQQLLGGEQDMNLPNQQQQQTRTKRQWPLTYVQFSLLSAVVLVWYALRRSQQQYYVALVFLGSSKISYIVLGNALMALHISWFNGVTRTFLGDLRLMESEGLSDFFRWNVTETCLALTMFRGELTVGYAIFFLTLILCKCLHWVVELREQHLRMTQEAVVAGWKGIPLVHRDHRNLFSLITILLFVDICVVGQCISDMYARGATITIFFCFEFAILLVTSMSLYLLSLVHMMDGLLHYLHEEVSGINIQSLLFGWKDRRATVTFALEVQSQASKFLLYLIFFGMVLTYYGLPINLFREVYYSFRQLRQRVLAFAKYRKLMASMATKFRSIQSEEQLEEAGRTCIICRDEMTIHDCKQLPGCGHIFHTSCLREWLVQQQSCPTCRADINVLEARQRQQDAAAAAEAAAAARQAENQEGEQGETEQQAEATGDESATETGVPADAGTEAGSVQQDPPTKTASKTTSTVNDLPRSSLQLDGAEAKKTGSVTSTVPKPIQTKSKELPRVFPEMFPAFYKVTNPKGAPVWIFDDDGNDDSMMNNNNSSNNNRVVRTVPTGTAMLCFRMQYRHAIMLEMPDGWVFEQDAQRLMQPSSNVLLRLGAAASKASSSQ